MPRVNIIILSPSMFITEDNIFILTYASSCDAIFAGGFSGTRGDHLSMAFLLLELVKKMSINPVECTVIERVLQVTSS